MTVFARFWTVPRGYWSADLYHIAYRFSSKVGDDNDGDDDDKRIQMA